MDHIRSHHIQVLSGVPQGTVVRPLLFLVFINDLPDCVESKTRLFADDCTSYRSIKYIKDCETLQSDLNNPSAWKKKWGMTFHPEKCSATRATRARKPTLSSYTVNSEIFARVLFSRNFAYARFRVNTIFAKLRNHSVD